MATQRADRDPRDEEHEQPLALANIEAEMALLAAVLARNEIFFKVEQIVRADHFADALHARIFEAIGRLLKSGMIANALTLKPEFDADPALRDIGGGKYLARISGSVITLLGVEDYAHVIRDLWMRRQLANLGMRVNALAAQHETPADELVAGVINDLQNISREGRETSLGKKAVIELVYNQMVNPPACYSTGIEGLDKITLGGFYAGRFYVFGARKKVGKTVMLSTISQHMNDTGTRHGFISAEMTPTEIEQRQAARILGVNPVALIRNPSKGLALKVAEYMDSTRDETVYERAPGCTLDDLQRIMSRMLVQQRVKGFIIDYWQKITGRGRNETQEQHQANVAAFIAGFCRKHGVFGLTAAQLNQEGNSRGGEGIKLECDMFLNLHREKDSQGAWLEMEESRYAPYENIGSDLSPGLWLINGTHFSDRPPPPPPDELRL